MRVDTTKWKAVWSPKNKIGRKVRIYCTAKSGRSNKTSLCLTESHDSNLEVTTDDVTNMT